LKVHEPRFVYPAAKSWQLIQAIKLRVVNLGIPGHFVSGAQALEWLEQFPVDIIDTALQISAAWYLRQTEKPSDFGFCRYTGGVLRKKDEAQSRVKELELMMKMDEWEAMTPEQQKEFPEGFASFRSFEVKG
jgi:hypothetical protein